MKHSVLIVALCSNLLFAMEQPPHEYLPEYVQQKIYSMVSTYQPLSQWMAWLIERNKALSKKEIFDVKRMQTSADHSQIALYLSDPTFYHDMHNRIIYYEIPPLIFAINCVGSFNHHAATHPFVNTQNQNGTTKITFFDKKELVIASGNEIFVDAATSNNDNLFAAISAHGATIWNIRNNNLISTIEFPDQELDKIVSLSNKSIVLQDATNTIFSCNLQGKNRRIIYSNHKWDTVYPIAFDHHYIFLHTQAKDQEVGILAMTDIAELFALLHFDQMKLLSWLRKAATTGHKLNLTGNTPGIVHARQALSTLPEPIRLLVQKCVRLPYFHGYCPPIANCTIS